MQFPGKVCILLGLLVLLSAVSCTSAAQAPTATMVPTIQLATSTVAPAQTPELAVGTAYPVVEGQAAVETAFPYPYPAGEGSGPAVGVPARDNRALVTAQFIEQAADADSTNVTRLHVRVTQSEDIEGLANFTSPLVSKEADLLVETERLVSLQPGDTFQAEVTYRGDEHGGNFYILTFVQ